MKYRYLVLSNRFTGANYVKQSIPPLLIEEWEYAISRIWDSGFLLDFDTHYSNSSAALSGFPLIEDLSFLIRDNKYIYNYYYSKVWFDDEENFKIFNIDFNDGALCDINT